MAAGERTGLDAVLYYNSATYGSPTWVVIPEVQDLSTNHDKDKAEVKSRNSRYAMSLPLHKKAPLEFKMLDNTAQTARTAVEAAWAADTSLDIAVADGPIATAGTEYWRADYYTYTFKKSQPITAENTVDVAMDLAFSSNPQAFVTVGS